MRALVFVLLLACSIARAGLLAGNVTEREGDAKLMDSQGHVRTLGIGDAVNEGDIVITGNAGQVHLRMRDDAYLAVRANTRLVIEAYRTDKPDEGISTLRLVHGSFRAVTGWIGQINPARYRVITPTASLGVRGTDHEPVFIPENEATPDQPAGTYDKVYEGGTVMEASGVRVGVSPGFAGFAPLRGRPRLLPALPAFLQKPPRLDEKLEALKPELRARMMQHLEQIRRIRETLKTAIEKIRLAGSLRQAAGEQE